MAIQISYVKLFPSSRKYFPLNCRTVIKAAKIKNQSLNLFEEKQNCDSVEDKNLCTKNHE